MKEGQTLWTREELILAINLYCKTPFGRIHDRNPDLIELGKLIGRTPGSISYKLVNFASLDPSITSTGRKGAVNASKLDKATWDEFFNNWDDLAYLSEELRAKHLHVPIENLIPKEEEITFAEGKTKERLVKVRVNQYFFRASVLAAYNNTCCITGINDPAFLVAGHINTWASDEANRMNPRNGIAINGLHDKAFETGLMTITPDYKIRVSTKLLNASYSKENPWYFRDLDGKEIKLPSRFLPDPEFLKKHNERFIL